MKNTGNASYHSGQIPAARVKGWRKANPGYWRRRITAIAATKEKIAGAFMLRTVLAEFALQDSCDALQDSWKPQVVALVGIIAWLGRDALQDSIAADVREIMLRGNAILHSLPPAANDQRMRTPVERH